MVNVVYMTILGFDSAPLIILRFIFFRSERKRSEKFEPLHRSISSPAETSVPKNDGDLQTDLETK